MWKMIKELWAIIVIAAVLGAYISLTGCSAFGVVETHYDDCEKSLMVASLAKCEKGK